MTHSTERAEKIEAGLTEAMRDALRLTIGGGSYWGADARTDNALERRGLIVRRSFGGMGFTPLGLAVRKIIEARNAS